jgi:hypothetical protein
MSFFKHVGKVNGKKVIIVQRHLPGEEHMAVVIYSDIMPSKYHDDVMQLLESEGGQQAFEFRDMLERRMMSDGQNMLSALSQEGYLKRVAANNVMVTPNSKSSMRLDELNALLNTVGKGEEAVKRLDRMEANQGMSDPAKRSVDSDTISLDTMNGLQSAPVAPAVAAPTAAPIDQTALMMQMMQTMQAMQQQLNDMKAPKVPKATTIPKNNAKVAKTKTSA